MSTAATAAAPLPEVPQIPSSINAPIRAVHALLPAGLRENDPYLAFGKAVQLERLVRAYVKRKTEAESTSSIEKARCFSYAEAWDELDAKCANVGLDVATVLLYLTSFETVCRGGVAAGPIGELPPRQRFLWLVAPRSTVIQTSPVHTGWLRDPDETLDRLLRQYVIPA